MANILKELNGVNYHTIGKYLGSNKEHIFYLVYLDEEQKLQKRIEENKDKIYSDIIRIPIQSFIDNDVFKKWSSKDIVVDYFSDKTKIEKKLVNDFIDGKENSYEIALEINRYIKFFDCELKSIHRNKSLKEQKKQKIRVIMNRLFDLFYDYNISLKSFIMIMESSKGKLYNAVNNYRISRNIQQHLNLFLHDFPTKYEEKKRLFLEYIELYKDVKNMLCVYRDKINKERFKLNYQYYKIFLDTPIVKVQKLMDIYTYVRNRGLMSVDEPLRLNFNENIEKLKVLNQIADIKEFKDLAL